MKGECVGQAAVAVVRYRNCGVLQELVSHKSTPFKSISRLEQTLRSQLLLRRTTKRVLYGLLVTQMAHYTKHEISRPRIHRHQLTVK